MRRMTVFDEMNRLFDEMRQSMVEGPFDVGYGTDVPVRTESDDEGYLVHADLPGFEREEIDLRYADGVLTIDARHEGSDDGERWTRSVNESLRIPGDILADEITASYHNGVLEVRLPSEDEPEHSGHRIEIE